MIMEPEMVDLEKLRDEVRACIVPIQPTSTETRAEKDFLFKAQKTEASRLLPPYYIVHFLLVKLMGFKDLGKFEKISFSIPIDYKGDAFLIEYRKFGLGIFARDAMAQNKDAEEIAKLIRRGAKKAKVFFDMIAEEASRKSELNVINNSKRLFDRFSFFLEEYKRYYTEAEARKDEVVKTSTSATSWMLHRPAYDLRKKSDWYAISAIEAFFSWTEHVFIHLAILQSRISTGEEVSALAGADWAEKFKAAISLTDKKNKEFFDELVLVRRQIRNFIAHGAFGKEGEAFRFHSAVGAVPIVMDFEKRRNKFSINVEMAFRNDDAIKLIEDFIAHLWSGPLAPAYIYLQESELPVILTMVGDGKYAEAMQSIEDMNQFALHLAEEMDRAINMDW